MKVYNLFFVIAKKLDQSALTYFCEAMPWSSTTWKTECWPKVRIADALDCNIHTIQLFQRPYNATNSKSKRTLRSGHVHRLPTFTDRFVPATQKALQPIGPVSNVIVCHILAAYNLKCHRLAKSSNPWHHQEQL